MLLYATTKSERASKGQGGNEFLHIEIMGKDEQNFIVIDVKPTTINGIKGYGLSMITTKEGSQQFFPIEEKGKKQKDEDACNGDDISCPIHTKH